jgi:RND family efflux transporter MFP subunit
MAGLRSGPGGATSATLLVAALAIAGCGDGGPAGRAGEPVATPVRADRVTMGDFEVYSRYSGELVGEVVDLAPRVGGRIQEVRLRIGNSVEAGDVVAVIDDTDLVGQLEEARGQLGVAEAQVSRGRAQLEEAEADFRRSEELFAQSVLSSQEFDRLRSRLRAAEAELRSTQAQVEQAEARVKRLEQQLADTRVVAPFAGKVASRYLDPGALVQPGTPVVRLVQDGPLLVQFRVPERDLGRLVVGHPLTLTTQATGERELPGHVVRISGEVSRSDRTVLVEGVVDAETDVLRSGMYAAVRVLLEAVRDTKIVPGVAVVQRLQPDGREETGVFGVDDEGRAVWHPVEVVGTHEHLVAIEGNIPEGATVLTLGHEEIGPESPVRIVEGPGR